MSSLVQAAAGGMYRTVRGNSPGEAYTQAIDPTAKRRVLDVVTEIGKTYDDVDIDDHEILQALARERPTYDPFGIFCRVYGGLMQLFGPWVVTIFAVAAMIYTVKRVPAVIRGVFRKLQTSLAMLGFKAFSAISPFFDEDSDDSSTEVFTSGVEMSLGGPIRS